MYKCKLKLVSRRLVRTSTIYSCLDGLFIIILWILQFYIDLNTIDLNTLYEMHSNTKVVEVSKINLILRVLYFLKNILFMI